MRGPDDSAGAGASRRLGTWLGVTLPAVVLALGPLNLPRLGATLGRAAVGDLVVALAAVVVLAVPAALALSSLATNHVLGRDAEPYVPARALGPASGSALGVLLTVAAGLMALLAAQEASAVAALAWPKLRILDLRGVAVVMAGAAAAVALYGERAAFAVSAVGTLAAAVGPSLLLVGGVWDPAPDARLSYAPQATSSELQAAFVALLPVIAAPMLVVAASPDLRDAKRSYPLGLGFALAAIPAVITTMAILLARRAPAAAFDDPDMLLRATAAPSVVAAASAFAAWSASVWALLGVARGVEAWVRLGAKGRWASSPSAPKITAIAVLGLVAIAAGAWSGARLPLLTTVAFLAALSAAAGLSALEGWANPDHRPHFRVPLASSVAAALGCGLAGLQIGAVGMAAAAVGSGLAYVRLRRRHATRDSSSTWAGVWTAIVRFGLRQLSVVPTRSHRHWRPNLIVVSRRAERGERVELAQALVGGRGVLTHFTLVEDGSRRAQVDEAFQAAHPGLFGRVHGCSDPFAAVPEIASSHGLTGLETNAVLFGWPREAVIAPRFVDMLKALIEIDRTVLLLRHHPARGWGRRRRVDIWWDGREHLGHLMLSIAHLLSTSPEWREARFRVLVIARPEWDLEAAQRVVEDTIAQARVQADGVLLPPISDDASVRDRMRRESAAADLVLLGLPPLRDADPNAWVSRLDDVMSPWGSTLLVRAARADASTRVRFRRRLRDSSVAASPARRLRLGTPAEPALAVEVQRLEQRLVAIHERLGEATQPLAEAERLFLEDVTLEIERLGQLDRRLSLRRARRFVLRAHLDGAAARLGDAVVRRVSELLEASEPAWGPTVGAALASVVEDLEAAVAALPTYVDVPTRAEDWRPAAGDDPAWAAWKLAVRLAMGLGLAPPRREVPLQALAEYHLRLRVLDGLVATQRALGARRLEALRRAGRLVEGAGQLLDGLRMELALGADDDVDVSAFRAVLRRESEGLVRLAAETRTRYAAELSLPADRLAEALGGAGGAWMADLGRLDAARLARSARTVADGLRDREAPADALELEGARWPAVHEAAGASVVVGVQIEAMRVEVYRAATALLDRLERELREGPVASVARASEILAEVELRLREASAPTRPSSGVEEAVEPGRRPITRSLPPDPDRLERRKAHAEAADALRTTWDEPYRPQPEDLMDPVLVALGRAAERIPPAVARLDEARMDEVLALGPPAEVPERATRRRAQAWLDEVLIEPARALLADLPDTAREAQDALVESCRLVAYELEHALDDAPLDAAEEERPSEASAAITVSERRPRVAEVEARLLAYLERAATVLTTEMERALEGADHAVLGGPDGAAEVDGLRSRRAERFDRAVAGARGRRPRRLAPAPARGHRSRSPTEEATVDAVQRLRTALAPRDGELARLPIVYRRLFGRAALDASDLLVGREAELARGRALVERWSRGDGGPIAVLGGPRSGRSTLAAILLRGLGADRPVLRVAAPTGGAHEVEALHAAVAEVAGARPGTSAEGALRALPPGAVVLVEDVERWLARAPGGLAAIEQWMRLWSRLGERHLFVVTTQPWFWSYAETLLGLPERFLGTVPCGPLDPEALADLLELRHRTSGLDLDLGLAEGRRRARGAARQAAFRRLHAQSRGSPGFALDAWRRSIVGFAEQRVDVRVAAAPDAGVLASLPPRWYAVLVSVALHRSLSPGRAAHVLRTSPEAATGLLADLARAGLLAEELPGAYGLDPLLMPPLLEALAERGLLP